MVKPEGDKAPVFPVPVSQVTVVESGPSGFLPKGHGPCWAKRGIPARPNSEDNAAFKIVFCCVYVYILLHLEPFSSFKVTNSDFGDGPWAEKRQKFCT